MAVKICEKIIVYIATQIDEFFFIIY